MPDELPNSHVETPAPAASHEAPASAGAPSVQGEPSGERRRYSDEEIDQLVAFSNGAYEELERIAPHRDKIKRFVEDEDFRQFVDSAASTYDQTRQQHQQQQQEEVPAWARPIVEDFNQSRQQRQSQHQQELNNFYAEQRTVANRIQRENNYTPQQISDLANYADTLSRQYNKRVGLDEAYEAVRRFSPATQNNGAPPTVGLRGDASTPGVPGPTLDRERFKHDFYGATLELARRGTS